jgi:hypothetical protein
VCEKLARLEIAKDMFTGQPVDAISKVDEEQGAAMSSIKKTLHILFDRKRR